MNPPTTPRRVGVADVSSRLLAVVLAVVCAVVFVVGTVAWSKIMTDTFSPLGYAMTPVGMYGLAIVLIPAMGVIHRLWTVGDARHRDGVKAAAERDRLRTSLLGSPEPEALRRVHAAPPPENLIFGEDEDVIRRRRLEGR